MQVETKNSKKIDIKGNILTTVSPPQGGWFHVKLNDDILKHLWKSVDEAKVKKNSVKTNLVGNISQSYDLIDENDYFFNELIEPLSKIYMESSPINFFTPNVLHNVNKLELMNNSAIELKMTDFWVNFQKKHEFNPPHNHSGLISFVIWLKIPYDSKEQNKLPFLNGIKDKDKKAGCFQFQYLNMFGREMDTDYHLDPSYEGTMVLFPSQLRHQVYPFYNCDEERVSISGNVFINPFPEKNLIKDSFGQFKDTNEVQNKTTKFMDFSNNNTNDTPQKLKKQRFTL